MKTILKISVFSILLLNFVSCDFNENVDNELSHHSMVDIATVQNPDSLSTFFLKLDNNYLLWTQESYFRNYRPKNGQRVIANYTILSDKRATGMYDYDISLNDIYEVLTKNIFKISPATQDSIGNDSITVEDMWIGSDYLNVQFVYAGYNQIHFINLVSDTSKTYTDGKIHLEFRHNAKNDSPVYIRRGYVSFNLKSLQTDPTKTLNLVIHVNVPNQAADKTYELTYTYNNSNALLAPKISFPQKTNSKVY